MNAVALHMNVRELECFLDLKFPAANKHANCAPSSPRATSLSLAPPPNAFVGSPPRRIQNQLLVSGISAARRVRSIRVPIADRPTPSSRQAPTGIASTVPSEHIRHAIGDFCAGILFTDRGKAVRACGVR